MRASASTVGLRLLALRLLTLSLLALGVQPSTSLRAQGEKKVDPVFVEYCQRLAKVHPRRALEHVALAKWCEENSLSAAAQKAYEQALRIDSDCVAAREALGFVRYGAKWIQKGAKPPTPKIDLSKKPPKPDDPKSPATAQVASAPANGNTATAPGDSAVASDAATSASDAPSETGAPERAADDAATAVEERRPPENPYSKEAIAEAIARKKAWAAEAAEKIKTKISTYEEKDYLLHTTLSKSSPDVRLLKSSFAAAKKAIASVLGAGGSTSIWPHKVQIVLLKSEPEFERFAQAVDDQRASRNPDGAYRLDGRVVAWRPDTPVLLDEMANSALLGFGGSDRWVAQWLRSGIASWLYADSPEGRKDRVFVEDYAEAHDYLREEGDAFKIFNIIESRAERGRGRRNDALGLTLVDYLLRKNRRGMQSFIRALKSEEAPPPPPEDGDFDEFWIEFVPFQEEQIEKAFRTKLDVLESKWKQYVGTMATKLQEEENKKRNADEKPKRKRRGGK